MNDPIKSLFTVLLDIAKTSPGGKIDDVMARVKSELDRNGELTNALQNDARMLQINQGQSKGYQVLVEGNATAYIGDRYEFDTEAVIKALGQLLDEIALNQSPVGTSQNLPRSGVVEFVGRDSKLKELHEQLQNDRRIAISAVQGMGGIGKTELALQYAINQLQQGRYPAGICWLRARDREIATDIVNFAQVHLGLKLPEQLEIAAQVAFCWQYWPEGEALVVMDDVTDYQEIEPYLPPADPRFKLLITTRLDLGSTVQKVAIEELDEDSAIALLESLVGADRIRSQLADAQALCKWVGYLPLALELLGRFLARKLDWSIGRLLKALDEKRLAAKALVETENGMTGQLGVAAALELSWQELNEAEQELACVLGMFAIAPIPDEDLPWPFSGIGRFYEGQGNYSFAEPWRRDCSDIIQQRVGKEHLYLAMSQNNLAETYRSQGKYAEAEPLYLSALEERIRMLGEEHLLVLISQNNLAALYCSQGKYEEAEPLYLSALEKRTQILGEEHLDVTTSQNNLAVLYHSQGRYTKAEVLYLSALEKIKRMLGEEHLDVATSQNNIAELYRLQGRYTEAEVFYLSSLKIYKCLLGEEHPLVATSQNNLAILHESQGRYEEAEYLYLSALEKRKQILGEEHPDFATSQNNLAALWHSQGRYEEAEHLYLSALEKRKKILGEKHPDVSTSQNNLATLYEAQGRYEEAELLYLSALEIQGLFGDRHPDFAISQYNLGILYYKQGRYPEAKALYTQALAISQSKLGSDHPMTQYILKLLNYLPQNPA